MEVLAYDIYPDPEYAVRAQIEYVSLDELYRRSDIISLHCPLTDETRYMIDGAAIGRMKPGVMLINTGRGQLIHTEALIEGLKEKKIGAAGLDAVRRGGRLFLRGYVGPDHGRRRAGAPALVQQCRHDLPSGVLYT